MARQAKPFYQQGKEDTQRKIAHGIHIKGTSPPFKGAGGCPKPIEIPL